jgi:hypothetical protein
MKYLLLIALMILPGCRVNFVMRGNLSSYDQRADTDGEIRNNPRVGATTIAAEKTTDLKADIPLVK